MQTFSDDYKQGNHVRIIDPMDLEYECEAIIKKLDPESGNYHVEMLTGDSKGTQKIYSAADLKRA